ncbi:MAG TPA: ATP-binding protein [Kofleriaceae bacterium]|nr:ATP-binding protein [Kofleriaceae bacterium]
MAEKGKSPFYPGQPVPVELFVGRQREIERILERGVGQVQRGKPVAMFIEGDYGIGKSSIANYLQFIAAERHKLLPIYVSLSGKRTQQELAAAILEATVRGGLFATTRLERLRSWFAKYLPAKLSIAGLQLDLDKLRADSQAISSELSLLGFLEETQRRGREDGIDGVFLVLDEINGVANEAWFAHFLKGLVDTNARSRTPVPLLLMLCGVAERRRQLIANHQPIDRIFDVVEIAAMSAAESREFFERAFDQVGIKLSSGVADELARFSAGFPKIMHIIGDWAYWQDDDGVIDEFDAAYALANAAEDVGKRYVEQQVYAALRSPDYRSILAKLGEVGPDAMVFKKGELSAKLTDGERKKLNNFLQKMKKLNVLRSGDHMGEYVFNHPMVRFYIYLSHLQALEKR